ncbi:MAG: thioredoxin family protein [Streptococcus salivarius]
MTTQLTTETFAEIYPKWGKFYRFWGAVVPPCRMMEPVVEELSQDFDGKVTIAQVDVDQSQDRPISLAFVLSQQWWIFKDGKPVDALVGIHPKQTLIEKIQAQLS